MSAEVIGIDEYASELWDAYLDAKDTAETTRRFEDAQRAARIFGFFLDFYSRDKEGRELAIAFVRHTLRRTQ